MIGIIEQAGEEENEEEEEGEADVLFLLNGLTKSRVHYMALIGQ